jgi:hypothetical protein
MKKFVLILFFFITSCYSINGTRCNTPSEYDQNLAQNYYDSFGVFRAHLTEEKARKLFGCNFHKTTDYIYSYSTLWGKKFILVRYGKVITWAE